MFLRYIILNFQKPVNFEEYKILYYILFHIQILINTYIRTYMCVCTLGIHTVLLFVNNQKNNNRENVEFLFAGRLTLLYLHCT